MHEAALCVLALGCLSACDEANPVVNRLSELAGAWTAGCDDFADGARCSLDWSVIDEGAAMSVQYRVSGAGGALLFEGEGQYRAVAGGFEGNWTDTNGSEHPLDSSFADGALTTLWGRPETEEGRTRYALDGDGGLSVTDWVKVDGEWRQFMHADYRRAGEGTE